MGGQFALETLWWGKRDRFQSPLGKKAFKPWSTTSQGHFHYHIFYTEEEHNNLLYWLWHQTGGVCVVQLQKVFQVEQHPVTQDAG